MYWSEQQGDVDPACIFKPSNALSVSSAVLISRLTQCPFAAKSGGHAAFAGASNIEGGITISFEKMNKVQVSADKKSAAIQPGNTWGGVYTKLADYEVTAVGGRVYGVGTGGLTLGGMSKPYWRAYISYLTPNPQAEFRSSRVCMVGPAITFQSTRYEFPL